MKTNESKWSEAVEHYDKAIEAVGSDPVPLIERSGALDGLFLICVCVRA